MSYHPDPDNDPDEAYAVIPMPAKLRGQAFRDWWTVTRNGMPVPHYPPQAHDLAMRFATDPAYRQQLVKRARE